MDIPTVSVVMGVFNGERYLGEAVESVLCQSLKDFEFIVVDDGSTDSSLSILEAYGRSDPRLSIIRQKKSGLTDALNLGCSLARGKYLARMDADDIAIQERLKWQVEFMEARPDVGVAGGAVELMDASGVAISIAKYPVQDDEIRRGLVHGNVFWHPTVLMRRCCFEAVGGYRKVVDAEDYDLWLRMAERFQLANLAVVLLRYRIHPAQVSVDRCREQALGAGMAQASASARSSGQGDPFESIGKITPAILAGLGVSESVQQTTLARGYLSCIRNLCRAGEYSLAMKVVDKALSSECRDAQNWVIADCHLWAAKLYWYKREIAKSALSLARALVARPVLLGRPLKSLLRKYRSGIEGRARPFKKSGSVA